MDPPCLDASHEAGTALRVMGRARGVDIVENKKVMVESQTRKTEGEPKR